MDWGLFWQAAGVGVAVLGIIIGGFWRMWALVKGVRDEAASDVAQVRADAALRSEAAHAVASATRDELHAHKLAVAENYVSKAGLREVEDRIMDGLGALAQQITGMSGRIDRWMERPPTTPRPRTS